MTDTAPLSADEFNKLAREGTIILPPDRDERAIHEYLVKVRGWRTVFTMRAPEQDVNGAHVRISREVPTLPDPVLPPDLGL